jgi:hypothetical protein
MTKKILLAAALFFLMAASSVSAQTIVYIPIDDRPVNLEYVIDTAKAAGVDIVAPPAALLGSRTSPGNPDGLWEWLFEQARTADGVVVSADSLLYGSLVASRTHQLTPEVLDERLGKFARLKAFNPGIRLYVYSTIMRTPRYSAGGVEPPYYDTHGPSIFRITALRDLAETHGLSRQQESELQGLLAEVPSEVLADWYDRREKNYAANERLIAYVKSGTFNYLLLGRDDCSPLSQSHMESRHLAAVTDGLPPSKYLSFPGADQLGILMVARAINNAAVRMPVVRVFYSPGVGPETVPSYEDVAVGRTVSDHIVAGGGLPLQSARADLVLAVNTPADGVTHEAGSPLNRSKPGAATVAFTAAVARELEDGQRLAVADIAFANGADNALMADLAKRKLLFRLAAYSGWNTASNTMGCVISQGMLSASMPTSAKDQLLAVRLLDDWAYQANIRAAVGNEVLFPAGGSWFYLDELSPRITTETDKRLRAFAAANFPAYPLDKLKVSFPWNRMFEVRIDL